MSKYIENQFFTVLPEPILKGTDLDLKIKVSGFFGATNWLNINKEDCELIKQIIENSYDRMG
jgi:hypothetical protein